MEYFIDPTCLYAETHEWVRVDGDLAYCGISDYAQSELNDVVFVEIPEVGDQFDSGDAYGVVESVKAASDVYLPVAGEIVETNSVLEENPEIVNSDPYGEGWFVRVKLDDADEVSELMDADAYRAFLEELLAGGTE